MSMILKSTTGSEVELLLDIFQNQDPNRRDIIDEYIVSLTTVNFKGPGKKEIGVKIETDDILSTSLWYLIESIHNQNEPEKLLKLSLYLISLAKSMKESAIKSIINNIEK